MNNILVREINPQICCQCKKPAQFVVNSRMYCSRHYNLLDVGGAKKVIVSEKRLESLPLESKVPVAQGSGLNRWGDFGRKRKKTLPSGDLFGLLEKIKEVSLYWNFGDESFTIEGGRKYLIRTFDSNPEEGIIFTEEGTPLFRFCGKDILEWYPYFYDNVNIAFDRLLTKIESKQEKNNERYYPI